MTKQRQTSNIAQVIKNKIERMKATFVFNSNGSYYLYRGDKIKPEHFVMMFPIEPVKTIVYN